MQRRKFLSGLLCTTALVTGAVSLVPNPSQHAAQMYVTQLHWKEVGAWQAWSVEISKEPQS